MNAQEQAEYRAYLKGKGFTDDEATQYMSEKGVPAPEPSSTQKVLSGIGKALDYSSNLGRGAVAGAYQGATGEDLGVNLMDVLKGETPSSNELMKRAGVPEGGKLSDVLPGYAEPGPDVSMFRPEKGGMLDPTLRGTGGFAADVAVDPLTYISMGVAPLLKKGLAAGGGKAVAAKAADVALNPLGKMVESGGEKLFKSGLKKVDTRAIEKGGEAVSPYLLERGIWGTQSQIAEGMDKQLAKLAEERAALYGSLDKAGAVVDPYAASQKALDNIGKLEKNPYMKPKAEAMMDYLSLADKPMSVSEASAVKTQLYDTLPTSAFDEFGRLSSTGSQLNKDLSQGYRQAILDAAEKASPGSGGAIDALNQEMGAYLGAQKPLRSEIAKEARKDLLTQTKAGIALAHPLSTLGMYAAQIGNATPVRTGVGLALDRAGESAPEALWRQLLLAPTRKEKKNEKN